MLFASIDYDLQVLKLFERNNYFFCSLQTTGRLVDLPRAVYTVDYERHSHHPIIAAGTSNFIYLLKRT